MTQKYPNTGRAWFNLGYAALQARDYATGVEAFNRAIALNHRLGTSSYNLACAYALSGNRDAAFQALNKARAAGFNLGNYLTDDEDLDALRDDPRYEALRKEVRAEKKSWLKIKNKNGNLDFDFDFNFDSNE
jgi:tetratricopeptide (TPR) repeat protein